MPRYLKLLGSRTYYNKVVGSVKKGEVVTVNDDNLADNMLSEENKDILNNIHPLFSEVTAAEAKSTKLEGRATKGRAKAATKTASPASARRSRSRPAAA